MPSRTVDKAPILPGRRRRAGPAGQTGVSGILEAGARHDEPPGPLTDAQSSFVRTLSAITEHACTDAAVRRTDLDVGDRVVVTTRNSVYSIWVLGSDQFAVSGGWFDRQGLSPARVKINGCTYGHSVIRHDVVAGRGLFLEFGNNVLTTRIQSVQIVRTPEPQVCH